ncbi:unnamed protein product [Paramecium sonneborni]|uniref:Uncharacterized protein n=1 Tax=Paramecium sonneborni TaxID=65129 RepID=A0A8S1N421_9CILI|nr:unnamed protein product [Paramecium sonneborni]
MQQQDSLFFQSQLYVAELCEPINLIEFVTVDVQKNKEKQQKISSGLQVSDQKQKMKTQNEKINPSKSNVTHKEQIKNHKQDSSSKGKNWIIKKLNEENQSKEVITCLPNLPKPLQNQGKLFSNTASKQIKQRLNKFILDQNKNQSIINNDILSGQNSSLPHLIRLKSDSPKQMPIYDVNFFQNFQQFFS